MSYQLQIERVREVTFHLDNETSIADLLDGLVTAGYKLMPDTEGEMAVAYQKHLKDRQYGR